MNDVRLEEVFTRRSNETCAYYCGDEDCDKCSLHGILVGYRCAGCKDYKSMRDYSKELIKEWED